MIEKVAIKPEIFEQIFNEIQLGIIIYHIEDLNDRESITIAGGNPAGSIKTDLSKLIGVPMLEAFPSLADSEFPELFIDVVRTGKELDLGDVTYGDENIPESIYKAKAFPLSNNYLGVTYEDITKEKLTEEALLKSNSELRAYDRIVSHDLKEPLNTITQLIGLLKNDINDSNKSALEKLDMLTARAKKASNLISSILTFSEVGKINAPLEIVDLKKCIDEVLISLEASILKKEAIINVESLPTFVKGVPIKIEQLFQNLIGNALKFQAKGNRPEVKIYRNETDDEKTFEIIIEDNGIGFTEDQAQQIFAPFKRLHGERSYEGSGIGLATCQRIADHHGWKIRAESEEGKGAKFIITIPKDNL